MKTKTYVFDISGICGKHTIDNSLLKSASSASITTDIVAFCSSVGFIDHFQIALYQIPSNVTWFRTQTFTISIFRAAKIFNNYDTVLLVVRVKGSGANEIILADSLRYLQLRGYELA